MHPIAYDTAQRFIKKYIKEGSFILDVGSQDINGTLKPLFPNCKYTGIDMQEGKNVDIVCNAHNMPFENNYFDAAFSVSCFEHDLCFWQTFKEAIRVVKKDGILYVSVPSIGEYHGYPTDCWRFYKDAGIALEYWINNFTEFRIKLIDQELREDDCTWKDNTMIFRKI